MSDLKPLNDAATQGLWGQFNPTIGPFKDRAGDHYSANGWVGMDTSHSISTVIDGKPYRIATFTHANDAALAEALVNAFRSGAWNTRAAPKVKPLEDWHEDDGDVTWWKFPVDEPPWIGTPNDSDWPRYHTHWTDLPPIPNTPDTET